jgi:hypothetical protein
VLVAEGRSVAGRAHRLSRASREALQQGHERDRPERLLLEPLATSRDAEQLLLTIRTDRYDEPTAVCELFEQCGRHRVRRGAPR